MVAGSSGIVSDARHTEHAISYLLTAREEELNCVDRDELFVIAVCKEEKCHDGVSKLRLPALSPFCVSVSSSKQQSQSTFT